MQLRFDQFGWYDAASIQKLRNLQQENKAGWYGVTRPPSQIPYFVPGANNAEEAIAAGMPREAAEHGKIATPLALLDG